MTERPRPRGVVRREPGAVGGVDGGPRRGRLLRPRRVPRRRRPAARRRDRGGRRCPRPHAAPPPVPLRHRHPVVGAARREGDRRRLLAGRHPPGPRDRRRHRDRGRPLRRIERVRAARAPRRRVRRRVHLARRARLAARHPRLGPGRRPLRAPGRDVLHHARSIRSSRRSRTRAWRPASCGSPTRTGSIATRSCSTSRAPTPTRRPTSASRRNTAGTTASARSSRRSSTPACGSSR